MYQRLQISLNKTQVLQLKKSDHLLQHKRNFKTSLDITALSSKYNSEQVLHTCINNFVKKLMCFMFQIGIYFQYIFVKKFFNKPDYDYSYYFYNYHLLNHSNNPLQSSCNTDTFFKLNIKMFS